MQRVGDNLLTSKEPARSIRGETNRRDSSWRQPDDRSRMMQDSGDLAESEMIEHNDNVSERNNQFCISYTDDTNDNNNNNDYDSSKNNVNTSEGDDEVGFEFDDADQQATFVTSLTMPTAHSDQDENNTRISDVNDDIDRLDMPDRPKDVLS